MYKILYAANNTLNSKIQLNRFLNAMKNTKCIIKIAGYKNKNFFNLKLDYNLEFLSHKMFRKKGNIALYREQIKNFSPDLIITDCEVNTAAIAVDLKIPFWNYSSLALARCFVSKSADNNIGKKNIYLLEKYFEKMPNIFHLSEKNYIYSHFGDLDNIFEIKDNFEWSRPYHKIGFKSEKRDIVGVTNTSNKNLLSLINKKNSVVFTNTDEKFLNITNKKFANETEYYCDLYNCDLFVCEGESSLLADAYYNNKKPLIVTNYKDVDCTLVSKYSENYNLITTSFDSKYNYKITCNYKPNIYYIHEKINVYIG